MKKLFNKIIKFLTPHKHLFKADGSQFYAGYMADGDVYLQNYKCECGETRTGRV